MDLIESEIFHTRVSVVRDEIRLRFEHEPEAESVDESTTEKMPFLRDITIQRSIF